MVTFDHSRDEIIEGNPVDILIILSQQSSMEIQVEISKIYVTTEGNNCS